MLLHLLLCFCLFLPFFCFCYFFRFLYFCFISFCFVSYFCCLSCCISSPSRSVSSSPLATFSIFSVLLFSSSCLCSLFSYALPFHNLLLLLLLLHLFLFLPLRLILILPSSSFYTLSCCFSFNFVSCFLFFLSSDSSSPHPDFVASSAFFSSYPSAATFAN